MVALLKEKAKIMKATKTRKTYDVADVFRKIPRVEGHTAYSNTSPPNQQT